MSVMPVRLATMWKV